MYMWLYNTGVGGGLIKMPSNGYKNKPLDRIYMIIAGNCTNVYICALMICTFF